VQGDDLVANDLFQPRSAWNTLQSMHSCGTHVIPGLELLGQDGGECVVIRRHGIRSPFPIHISIRGNLTPPQTARSKRRALAITRRNIVDLGSFVGIRRPRVPDEIDRVAGVDVDVGFSGCRALVAVDVGS
jgi:hypothetical protein